MEYFKFDALYEDPIESGEITKDKFESLYLNFPWLDMLKKQNEAKQETVKCSPGIIVRNEELKEVYVSIVGNISDYEFYVSYKRPKLRKKRKWYITVEYLDENYFSIVSEQSLENGLEASLFLFDKDYDALEKKYG